MKNSLLLFSFILLSFAITAQTGQKDSVEKHEIMYEPPKEMVVEEREKSTADSTKVFEYVDKFPTFPGGMNKYEKYLMKNIKYPKYASTRGIEGVVYVSMLVDEEGNISDVKVLKAPHPSLGEEAVRVISAMPSWEPGELNGNPVKVRISVRIKYTLRDPKAVKKDNGAKIEKKK